MNSFAAYGYSIVALVLYGVIAQVLNAMTGIKKGSLNMQPGESHAADYANPAYRLDRTYMNSVENLVILVTLVVAAVLAGANPLWTNIFASVALLARIAGNVMYLRAIGKGYGGIRTQMAIAQAICMLGLAVLALIGVFFK